MLNLYKKYKKVLTKAKKDEVSAYAGQSTFFILISLFPFVMLLMTFLHYVPAESTIVETFIQELLPQGVREFAMGIIKEIRGLSQTTAIVSLTSLTALWAASAGILAIIRALNAINGEYLTQNYFVLRIRAAFYALIFAVIMVLVLLLLNFGNTLFVHFADFMPNLNSVTFLITFLRVLIAFLLLTVFFTIVYSRLPQNKPRVKTQLPGALLCACIWIAFSFVYSIYISHMGAYSKTYGSLTAAVLLMLWLYYCIYVMLICAEVNGIIFKGKNDEENK